MPLLTSIANSCFLVFEFLPLSLAEVGEVRLEHLVGGRVEGGKCVLTIGPTMTFLVGATSLVVKICHHCFLF